MQRALTFGSLRRGYSSTSAAEKCVADKPYAMGSGYKDAVGEGVTGETRWWGEEESGLVEAETCAERR